MIHKQRKFSITDISSAHELAHKLSQHTWTLCTGFRHAGYLFLNDSFSEDGAAEYAVVRESDGVQVESITFGWCSEQEALGYIKRAVAGEFDSAAFSNIAVLKHGKGYCQLCA